MPFGSLFFLAITRDSKNISKKKEENCRLHWPASNKSFNGEELKRKKKLLSTKISLKIFEFELYITFYTQNVYVEGALFDVILFMFYVFVYCEILQNFYLSHFREGVQRTKTEIKINFCSL